MMDSLEKINHENEIDLLNLLRVLWRWKLMIAGICMVCTLLAFAITSYLPKVYRITAIIEPGKRMVFDQNGQIVDQKIVVSPAVISDVLLAGIFNQEIAEKLSLKNSDIPRIKTKIIESANLLEISLESKDTQKGLSILNEVIPKISSYIQKKIEPDNMLLERQKKACENEYRNKLSKFKLVKEQEAQIRSQLHRLEGDYRKTVNNKSTEILLKFLYSKEVLDNQIYLNSLIDNAKDLEQKIQELEIKLAELQQEVSAVQKIIVRSSPTIEDKPIKPKTLDITTAVFFISLVLSIIISLILENFRPKE